MLFVTYSLYYLPSHAAGGGGKGTWGKLLAADSDYEMDRNDPNYDGEEVCYLLISNPSIYCVYVSVRYVVE